MYGAAQKALPFFCKPGGWKGKALCFRLQKHTCNMAIVGCAAGSHPRPRRFQRDVPSSHSFAAGFVETSSQPHTHMHAAMFFELPVWGNS